MTRLGVDVMKINIRIGDATKKVARANDMS